MAAFQDAEHMAVTQALTAFLERRRPPPSVRHEVDLAYRIEGQSAEIFEVRPAWRGEAGEVIELRIAKATYVRAHDHWRVYWQRADLKWHRYDPAPVVPTIEDFLELVERDEYAAFFG